MTILIAVFSWFFIILIFSSLIVHAYRGLANTELKLVLDIVLFIGVFIHEIAHACILMCMGFMPKRFKVQYRSRVTGRASPHGSVILKKEDNIKMSFMQGLFVALAPLFVSTFTFLFMLDVIFNTDASSIIKIVASVVLISVVIGSYPSEADINVLVSNFQKHPEKSFFQLILGIISVALVIFYIDLNFLVMPFEVMYYILYCLVSIGIYFGLKGIIYGCRELIIWIIDHIPIHTSSEGKAPPSVRFRKLRSFRTRRKLRKEVK
ncbi:MAG: hypothetical protein ACFFKA_16775, partial [Candidatus Thorarchaeota archaeon]